MFFIFLISFIILIKSEHEVKITQIPSKDENSLSMDGLKKKILSEMESAEKRMDMFYNIYNKEEEKHKNYMLDIIEKAKKDSLIIMKDFMEILHMKIYENTALIQNEIRRHLSEIPKDDKTFFNEFKKNIIEYTTREELKRKMLEKIGSKKDVVLSYLNSENKEQMKQKGTPNN